MIRIFGPGLFGMLMMALWVYAVLDAIATEAMLVRNLPKMTWLFIVLLFPGIGAIAWLALGRPLYAGWRPGDTAARARPTRQVRGPEDSDAWRPASTSSSNDMAARERRVREREAELDRRERRLDNND